MLEYQNVYAQAGRTPILENCSVSFPTGKLSIVVGQNGCGKTTLLQCLNGASRVTEGKILLNGADFLSLSLKERAKRIAFLPQTRAVIPTLPVQNLVEHGRFPWLGFARRKSEKDREIVEDAMRFAGTDAYAMQRVDTLSGGMRQRAFFAMTLAQDCDVIVLDEPTTYLDLPGQRQFMKSLVQLSRKGKTVIAVLHDLSQALQYADLLVVMENRQIAAVMPPKQCLKSHILEQVFDAKIKTFSDAEGTYYVVS